jgi:hypothetical protein
VFTVEAGGPESIVAVAASTVHWWRAGLASSVPTALLARTSSSCAPTVS